MHLYECYIREREGLKLLEKEYGFLTYKIRGADCYIQDIYVIPSRRKEGLATHLADELAILVKHQNIRILTGSVDERAYGAQDSAKVLKAYGMSPYSKDGSVTYYFKEI